MLDKQNIYVQKVADRLAFERGETRLYSLAINRLQNSSKSSHQEIIDLLKVNRQNEENHAALVKEALRSRDPGALESWELFDGVNLAYRGFFETIVNPHSDLPRIIQILFFAKLADHAEWEILIHLAQKVSEEKRMSQFEEALTEELKQLSVLKQLYLMAIC